MVRVLLACLLLLVPSLAQACRQDDLHHRR